KNEIWEIGCDVRYWLLAGQLMCIDLPERMEAVIAGEEFGKIYTGSGQAEPLISPMTGKVIDLNHNANAAMSALIRDNLSEGWLLWLARIQLVTTLP
ncbi:MAG: hypothetical protein IVZ94_02770, partial [Nitrospirae bacterium]|nr:hypothetical protein [Nitrospirota bacterium]